MNSSSSTSIARALCALALVAAPLGTRAQRPTQDESLKATFAAMEAAADDMVAAANQAEAAAFMETYAADLRAGNRAAIAARYDRAGAWRQGNGDHVLDQWSTIEANYAGEAWSRPFAFEWRDLTYEPAGPDAIVVAGVFLWTVREGQPPIRFSYTSLLVRRDGGLRIRLEHESMQMPPPPAGPAS